MQVVRDILKMQEEQSMRKFLAMLLAGVMVLSLNACKKASNNESSGDSGSKESKKTLSMDDIDWTVDEGVIDGERYILMSYTNNSPYIIAGVEISFMEKEDITDEEKETYYSEVQKDFELSDEDLAETKEREISMYTESKNIADVGESVSNVYCYYYRGGYYLRDINHYNLVKPDVGTIRYLDDGKMYTAYYDFHSGKLNVDDEIVDAYQWSESNLVGKIPKPDVHVVEAGLDDEDYFSFDAYGMSLEQFNAYVDECKAKGFTVDVTSHEGFYSADNEEKYNVFLSYDKNDESMHGNVDAP